MNTLHIKRRYYITNHCDRCKKQSLSLTMSYFNTEMICNICDVKEHNHPDFEQARTTEFEKVKNGNYNFLGVGKPKDL